MSILSFEQAVLRRLEFYDETYFYIVPESTNVVHDIILKDEDNGKIYEIRGEDAGEEHKEMLRRNKLVLGYKRGDTHVCYRERKAGEESIFDIPTPIE